MSKKTLIIEVDSRDESFLKNLQTTSSLQTKLFYFTRLEGGAEIIQALVVLATVTVPVNGV